MAGATPASLRTIGALAVRFHMLTEEQLQQLISQQDGDAAPAQLLVDSGVLSAKQLTFLHDAQEMKAQRIQDVKFGDIAVLKEYATRAQVDSALLRQKQQFIKQKKKRLVGDILVADGVMTEEQKQSVAQIQQGKVAVTQTADAGKDDSAEQLLGSAEGIELIVSKDRLQVTLRVHGSEDTDTLAERIEELLLENGIVHGRVAEEELASWLQQGEERSESFVIARGDAPVPGHGGEIRYHFDTDPLKAGALKEGGVIDFKDRGEIPQVSAGTKLAEITEPDPGVAGTDVYGEVIPPPAVKAKKLLTGHGVSLVDDNKGVVADVDGTPSLAMTGAIAVFPLYNVDGNVGYKTGHVDFDGDIQVSGTIEKDFRVTGGRLSAKEVEGAEIDVKGDAVISGGIIGGHIRAGGNVMAAYIHNATLEVDGDVFVQKEIMGCDIKAGGGLYSETSIVLDSRISARGGIIAGDIGSDVSGPSTLAIGSDALLELRIEEIKETMQQQRKQQDQMSKDIEAGKEETQQIDMEIAEVAQVQDRSQIEVRELGEQRDAAGAEQAGELEAQIAEATQRAKEAEQKLNELFDRQDQIASEAQQMEQEITAIDEMLLYSADELDALEQQLKSEQEEVYVKVTGTLYPMTTITTTHTSVKTKQAMRALIIRETARRNEQGDEVWKMVTESLKN